MEKLRAWSTPGTFPLPFLHDRLFGGKGHRKDYKAFFTSSDSLKCLTRKTVASTLHLSLQLKLIYSQCHQGTRPFCGHLSPVPRYTAQPYGPAKPHGTGLGRKPMLPNFFIPFLFCFGSYTFQEKCHGTSNQSNAQKSTRHIPNRTS